MGSMSFFSFCVNQTYPPFHSNNNGIAGGVDAETFEALQKTNSLPVSALLPETRYEKFAEAVGGKGYLCRTPSEIRAAMTDALKFNGLAIINVLISPSGGRKAQSFSWLERKETKL